MKPDNALSRVIRPMTLVWFSLVFTALMLTDGNFRDFTVKEVYIGVLESILVTMFAAYFLGKSGEHISRINKKKKDPNDE